MFFPRICNRKVKTARKSEKKANTQEELELETFIRSIPKNVQITEENRRDQWLYLIKQEDPTDILRKSDPRYAGVKSVVFGTSPADCSMYPTFGCLNITSILSCMDELARQKVIRVLIIIYELNKITWCPTIVPIVIFLQSLFSESESYHIINYILETRQLRNWLLVEEESEFRNLLTVLNIPVDQHSSVLYTISTLYLDKHPINTLLSLFDHYLMGGILFLIHLEGQNYQTAIEQANQLRIRWERLRQTARELEENSSENVVTPSHALTSSSMANTAVHSNSSLSTSPTLTIKESEFIHTAISASSSSTSPHQKNGEVQEKEFRYFIPLPRSRLMTREQWYTLLPSLPRSLARHLPTLLYTSYEDGYCLDFLLPRIRQKSPTLLLVELPEDVLVGIYREDEWEDNRLSFGRSSTRLLRKGKGGKRYEMWEGVEREEGDARFVYLRSTRDCILVGAGGKKGIALCISNDFSKSYSQQSDVFGNPALFQKEFFSILNIEAFHLL